MPELPEVETIRLQLEKVLVGKNITDVEIKSAKSFSGDPKLVIGAKILALRRFGKVTVVDLDNEYSLLIHLKLTGQLLINGVVGPYSRVIIHFGKDKLVFNDQRIFGWIKIVKTKEVSAGGLIGKLGPEPLKDLSFDKFKEIISTTIRPIKIILMDQEKISGIGNIYANDALWFSRINPRRPAKSLREIEMRALFDAVQKVLKDGLKFGGASDQHYIKPDGTKGMYQQHFLVYGKKGKPCGRCKTKIVRIALGGRGTFLCPNCQK